MENKNLHIYKKGDYVVIRNDLVLGKSYNITDLDFLEDRVTEEMFRYQGKVAKIVGISLSGTRFYLDIDGRKGDWNSTMVIPYNPIVEKLKELLKC